MANVVASPSTTCNRAVAVERMGSMNNHEEQVVLSGPKLLSGRRSLRNSATRKRFDSGDWCLERLGLLDKDSVPLDVPAEQLSPKLHPEVSLPRTPSFLLRSASPQALVTGI